MLAATSRGLEGAGDCLRETVKAPATTGMPRQSNGDSIVEPTACTHNDWNAGFRLLKPPGNRFVSTGATLKPLLRRSTEA